MIWRFFIIIFLFGFSAPIYADELRPSYVELTQVNDSDWDVFWKASELSPLAQGSVILPKNCSVKGEAQKKFVDGNILTTFSMVCQGNIYNGQIGLRGLEFSINDALVRISGLNSDIETIRLTPNENIAIIPAPEGANIISNVASAYTVLGFEHIIEGYDHLLFVLALVLLIPGLRLVAWTVTAFTIAHSITLIGTSLGYLSLPPQPVEAVIALSIIFLALEVVQSLRCPKGEKKRLSQRYPWVIAFSFGLLHGFGFAGALAEIGLPQNDVPLALLTFNIGVELGQMLIVIIAIATLRLITHFKAPWLRPIKIIISYGIGIVATYWFIERMIG